MSSLQTKWLRFAAVFALLALLCFGSVASFVFSNSTNTVTVKNSDSLPMSINGHHISQTLRLEGELKEILLFCSAPNGSGYQDASVTFTVSQGEKSFSRTVPAKEITQPYSLKLPFWKFQAGNAELTIFGEGFPEGTDLFFFCSQDKTSGLELAQMDENIVSGPFLMHYTVVRHDGYFFYDCIIAALLLTVILVVSWLISFRRDAVVQTKGLFFCSFFLLFFYISLRNPAASFLGEPRSEMAYEFWYKAKYLSFTDNLMSLMSGESLVWTERLMMWLAVHLSGSGKYVFSIAQLMQTVFICCVSSMLCLPTFRRFFSAEIRLLLCWYMGGVMLFPSAYLFWAVSYWASFFLIPFAFVDMEKMPRWQYGLAMILSVVLCVSRIYHILYIPMALFALIVLGKSRGKRFSLYCIIVAVASGFEVVYSIVAGGSGHIETSMLEPIRFLGNALFYQVQTLRSMILGNVVSHDLMLNIVFLAFFVGTFVLAVYLLIFKWNNLQLRTISTILIVLGALSFGSVLINVTVSGCSASVAFPCNYAAPVSWNSSYYQNGDLHFSYAYFAVLGVILTLFYFFKNGTTAFYSGSRLSVLICAMVILLTCVNVQEYVALRMIETSWRSCYWVTANPSYYMPINVSYQFADISLYHNSTSIICGKRDDASLALWEPGAQTYSSTYDYCEIAPGQISDLAQRGMLALSARKSNINFRDPLVLILYSEDGTELQRVPQTNTYDRYRADFMLEEPVYGVYSVAFRHEDGSAAYVCDGIHIGVTLQ